MSPEQLRQNIETVLLRIEKAATKSGRKPEEIKLIAVTKTVNPETINLAFNFGLKDFGENRVQELLQKIDFVNPLANFHMIGHLQTNKVKYLIDKVKSIQ